MLDYSKLEPEQADAFQGITDHLSQGGPQSAILTGAGGTGKTFLCSYLAKELNPVLCALTHKAAAVLSKELTDQSGEERKVYTLAKILQQRKYNDLQEGTTHFKSESSAILLPDGKKTLFIDESSMMNQANLDQVKSLIGPHYNVLYIGDRFQIPPVNENQSHALLQKDIPSFELFTPRRYGKKTGIGETALSIRTSLKNQLEDIPGMRDILGAHKDVSWVSADEAYSMMVKDFTASTEVNDVRVISYTNSQVEAYNNALKFAVTGEREKMVEGDLMISNEASHQFDDGGICDTLLMNNASVRIKEIEEVTHLDLPAKKVLLDTGKFVYVPVDRTSLARKIELLKNQALSCPKGSKERSTHFRKMFVLKESFADLRLNYAQTIHKSQGSSYKVCYFDLTRLDPYSTIGKRLLYTGVTRASERLVLFR